MLLCDKCHKWHKPNDKRIDEISENKRCPSCGIHTVKSEGMIF